MSTREQNGDPDVGAAYLAFTLLSLLVLANVKKPMVVPMAGAVLLVFNVLHFVYHLTMLHMYEPPDQVLNVVLLSLLVVMSIVLVIPARRTECAPGTTRPGAGPLSWQAQRLGVPQEFDQGQRRSRSVIGSLGARSPSTAGLLRRWPGSGWPTGSWGLVSPSAERGVEAIPQFVVETRMLLPQGFNHA